MCIIDCRKIRWMIPGIAGEYDRLVGIVLGGWFCDSPGECHTRLIRFSSGFVLLFLPFYYPGH